MSLAASWANEVESILQAWYEGAGPLRFWGRVVANDESLRTARPDMIGPHEVERIPLGCRLRSFGRVRGDRQRVHGGSAEARSGHASSRV
jgi:hypothetical protein